MTHSLCRNTGLVGPPWVPVFAQAPSISNQRDSLSGRRPPNPGGRNRCCNGAARRLPAPPSRTAPRNNAPPVSVDETSCSDRAPEDDSPLVSMNSASGSGTALNNTGTSTPVPPQSQGADPVNETSPRHNLNSTARVRHLLRWRVLLTLVMSVFLVLLPLESCREVGHQMVQITGKRMTARMVKCRLT